MSLALSRLREREGTRHFRQPYPFSTITGVSQHVIAGFAP